MSLEDIMQSPFDKCVCIGGYFGIGILLFFFLLFIRLQLETN